MRARWMGALLGREWPEDSVKRGGVREGCVLLVLAAKATEGEGGAGGDPLEQLAYPRRAPERPMVAVHVQRRP